MLETIIITSEDIFHQIKLSCQIPEFIEKFVTRKVIENAAFEAGIKVETQELQKAADQYRLMNQLENAETTWKWLEHYSLSLDEFEELVYSHSLSNKLFQHLFADKVEPYFFEHQLDYTGAVIYEIVFDDEELAMELFYAIRENEISFYDVAHKYIQDAELRRKGGYLGIMQRKDLKPEISAAVFSAKPPQLLKPIITSKGVYLILVEEIIQQQLNDTLRQIIGLELFSEWLKEQITKVEIIKNLNSNSPTSNL